jgi:hypothetical protein
MTCFSEERELFNIFPDRQRFLQEKNFWWKDFILFVSSWPYAAMPLPGYARADW